MTRTTTQKRAHAPVNLPAKISNRETAPTQASDAPQLKEDQDGADHPDRYVFRFKPRLFLSNFPHERLKIDRPPARSKDAHDIG